MKINPSDDESCSQFSLSVFLENIGKFDEKYRYIGRMHVAYFWLCFLPLINLTVLGALELTKAGQKRMTIIVETKSNSYKLFRCDLVGTIKRFGFSIKSFV